MGVLLAIGAALALLGGEDDPQPLPELSAEFLRAWCLDCHDAETHKGELTLEGLELAWSAPETARTLERMRRVLADGDMPPPRFPQPPPAERAAQVAWLDAQLAEHQSVGGAVLRRLNRSEYVTTVHTLFPLQKRLEVALPPDAPSHGFDTVGEALVISPTHMRQYLEAATWIADELIPLDRTAAVAADFAPGDFAGNKAHHLADRTRLVNSIDVIARSTARAERFLAPRDGVYRIRLTASAWSERELGPLRQPRLEVRAWLRSRSTLDPVTETRLLASFELPPAERPQDAAELTAIEFEGELFRDETLLFYYANAPLCSEDRYLRREVSRHYRLRAPELYNALMAVGYDRDLVDAENYARLSAYAAAGGARATDAQRDEFKRRIEAGRMTNDFVTLFGYYSADHGPAVDLHALRVEGPVRELEHLARYLPPRDQRPAAPEVFAESVLRPLLFNCFRRPVEEGELERYLDLTLAHAEVAGSIEHGLHLALRTVLCSPQFLYRGARAGPLDDYDLVTRLAYFLWNAGPPPELLELAGQPGALEGEALVELVRRMVASPRASQFAESFTGQWLSTRALAGIMPDERLFPSWNEGLYRVFTQETEAFFLHVLRENLPLASFLDSDFAFLNQQNARLYGIPGVDGAPLRRVELPPDSPRGGVLGMGSVMMATANGVDTSPVLRGVWVLDNLLGERPPPPPDDVPALTPDAGGARTVREALAVHRADPSCARCHDDIDPLGFALEELDPIGGWRAHYPELAVAADGTASIHPGPPVDASAELPDGTRIDGLLELKRYLVEHSDAFALCLADKLLLYSSGRVPNAADRRELAALLERLARAQGTEAGQNDVGQVGLLDLVIALVQSPAFRTK